jgi:hypothetical protein
MIFLLCEPIIGLVPCIAPASDASHTYSVALTAQADTSAEGLNKIYRLTIARVSRFALIRLITGAK